MRYQVEMRENMFAVVDTDITMPRTGEYVLIALLPDRRTALDYAEEQNTNEYLYHCQRQEDEFFLMANHRALGRLLQRD